MCPNYKGKTSFGRVYHTGALKEIQKKLINQLNKENHD